MGNDCYYNNPNPDWGVADPTNNLSCLISAECTKQPFTTCRGPSGSALCVKAVTGVDGPSERMTVDLANLDASTLNVVLGQSGALFSPHYMDQFDAWYEGRTYMLAFSEIAVAKAKTHELVLEPK